MKNHDNDKIYSINGKSYERQPGSNDDSLPICHGCDLDNENCIKSSPVCGADIWKEIKQIKTQT